MSYSLIKLNSARNCLRYIVRAFKIKEIYIPYYICPAIRLSLSKENCKIHYYHIDDKFFPDCEFKENAYILYPNYFGVCNENIIKLSKKYNNLIVDNAHSFYSEPFGIASFNSLRKFFPFVRDGAFLYTKKLLDSEFIQDKYDYEIKSLSYEEICKNELRIDREDIMLMSKCSERIFSSLNIEKDKNERIKTYNKYFVQNDYNNIPFGIPILCENKNEAIKKVIELKKQGYEIYKYWNNLPDSFLEKMFYERLVVVPAIKNGDN